MKRMLLAMVSVFFVVSMFAVGVACAEEVKAKGTLKSVDAAKGMVVFCPEGTKDEVSIKVTADDVKGMKDGEKVTITYDKGKENVAKKIKKARDVKVPVGC